MKIRNWKLKIRSTRGIASLATMLVLGAVIVQLGIVVFTLSYYLTSSNAGVKFSSYARAAAQAGLADGMMRVIRRDYQSGYTSYSIPGIGNAASGVTICEHGAFCGSTPPLPGMNQVKITSSGSALSKKAFIVAIVEVHPVTRLVRIVSVEEKDSSL